ncbi:MAG: hypothetical protein ACRD2L_07465, partial [Terriglobia bacterium]
DKARLELVLARKAMQAQGEVEEMLRQIPDFYKNMSENPSGALAKLAEVQIRAGQSAAGAETLSRAATAGKASMEAAESQLNRRIQQGMHIASAMEGVTDAAGWYAAITGLTMLYPEAREQLDGFLSLAEENENFDHAGAAQKLASTALTEVDKAKRDQAKAAAEYSRQHAAESKVKTEILIPAQAANQLASAEHHRKVGGGLRNTTITDAEKLIKRDYSPDEDELRVLAVDLSEDAEVLLREQPGLGRTNALLRAYQAARSANRFAGLTTRSPRLGAARSNPFSLPLDGRSIETQKLLKNKWYRGSGSNSGAFLWTGTEFLSEREVEELLPEEESEEEFNEPEEEED